MTEQPKIEADCSPIAERILGYLNFSSGPADAKVFSNIASVYEALEPRKEEPLWAAFYNLLAKQLNCLEKNSPAFSKADQARAVLDLTFKYVLPGYRDHHSLLLSHQSQEELYSPYFIGRVFESVLTVGGPWGDKERDRIVHGAIFLLNDFIGHRPLAVLANEQECEPYPHERIRPIPLFVKESSVAPGRYQELITYTLEILKKTSPSILQKLNLILIYLKN